MLPNTRFMRDIMRDHAGERKCFVLRRTRVAVFYPGDVKRAAEAALTREKQVARFMILQDSCLSFLRKVQVLLQNRLSTHHHIPAVAGM